MMHMHAIVSFVMYGFTLLMLIGCVRVDGAAASLRVRGVKSALIFGGDSAGSRALQKFVSAP